MAWVPKESAVEELMPRLLPVEPCDLTEGFDPSVPPRTPQEYLRRVQIEAARCPDVVVAQIDPKKLKRKQSVNVSRHEIPIRTLNIDPNIYELISSFQDANLPLKVIPQHFSGNSNKWPSFQLFDSIVSRMNQGRWFYALLACLEKPLLPEAHSLIRQLARRCSEVRLSVDTKDDERVPALNLLICLVSRYS
ncbi:Survival of motor neuron protein-interacting protein 1 [Heterocephalus glaber]|uniref:Survival of motor neuron protein-interacting protein 1 n=1 Tax=Heterocephalus glaber TaxID=10181 RepID=G5C814_HETGA|nr:Survival of motor neuron protein-interacting protein 1 [Heterocephalus glaber]